MCAKHMSYCSASSLLLLLLLLFAIGIIECARNAHLHYSKSVIIIRSYYLHYCVASVYADRSSAVYMHDDISKQHSTPISTLQHEYRMHIRPEFI
jgi:hypothetical protein